MERFGFRRKGAYEEDAPDDILDEVVPVKKDRWRVRMAASLRSWRRPTYGRHADTVYHRAKYRRRSPSSMKFRTGEANAENLKAVRTARAKENAQRRIKRYASQDVREVRAEIEKQNLAVGERPMTLKELRQAGADAKIKGAWRMNTAQLREALSVSTH